MTSQQEHLILAILDTTDQFMCLADALANSAGMVSKAEETHLRHEIEKIRNLTETARNHLRIRDRTQF